MGKRKEDTMEQKKKKNGSSNFWSIFMHADGVDRLLMTLGLLGAVGDGVSMPAMLTITSKLTNNVGSAISSSDISSNFTHNINQV